MKKVMSFTYPAVRLVVLRLCVYTSGMNETDGENAIT